MRISDWSSDVCSSDLTDGSETSVSLQPLVRINATAERAWAADWLVAILRRESIAITPEVKEHLWSALSSLASAPAAERTLTGLSVLLQRSEEHTSELQSLMRISYAVFCLKKKKIHILPEKRKATI